MQDPYKNNSYLRDDAEALSEVLFFEKFGKKVQKDPGESSTALPTKDLSGSRMNGVDASNESHFLQPGSNSQRELQCSKAARGNGFALGGENQYFEER